MRCIRHVSLLSNVRRFVPRIAAHSGVRGVWTMAVNASLRSRLGSAGTVGAAATVFARLGFAATRVEDILAAAGIARRTFYKSFASKEDVLAAVYQLAIQELLGAMTATAGRGS